MIVHSVLLLLGLPVLNLHLHVFDFVNNPKIFIVNLLLYFLFKELVKVSTDCAFVDRIKIIIIIVIQ